MFDIFISYSRNSPESRLLLDEFEKHFAGAGFRLLIDTEIRGGEVWDQKLKQWIAQCHAAVVLISKPATVSDWVSKEVERLQVRRERNADGFLLIPVFVPDATVAKDLANGRLQFTQIDRLQALVYKDPEQLRDDLLHRLKVLHRWHGSKNPHERRQLRITDRLKNSDRRRLLDLGGACNRLGIVVQSTDYEDLCFNTASALMSMDQSTFVGLLRAELSDLEPQYKTYIVDNVTPYTWVDPGSALILCLYLEIQTCNEIRLEGEETLFTPRQYLIRAGYTGLELWIVHIDGTTTEAAAKELLQQAHCALAYELGLPETASCDDINTRIKEEQEVGAKVVLVVPLYTSDFVLLEPLRRAYPELNLFLLIRQNARLHSPPAPSSPNQIILRTLDLEHEKKALRLYETAVKLARQDP